MIQKMSDQHKINFLDKEKTSEQVVEVNSTLKKTLNQISEEQKAKRLSNKDNGLMTSQHISSARTGEVTNEGSPSKYVKSDSSNTIWDSNKISEVSKELDNKTKTIQEKDQISSNRREAENKRMNDLADALKSTSQDKVSSISSFRTYSGTNYKVSANNMSIFDNKDFMRVEDKTDGEKISEDVQKRRNQIDNSWRGGGKSLTSSEITKTFFDGIFTKSEY